jgi:hypothetical protein
MGIGPRNVSSTKLAVGKSVAVRAVRATPMSPVEMTVARSAGCPLSYRWDSASRWTRGVPGARAVIGVRAFAFVINLIFKHVKEDAQICAVRIGRVAGGKGRGGESKIGECRTGDSVYQYWQMPKTSGAVKPECRVAGWVHLRTIFS